MGTGRHRHSRLRLDRLNPWSSHTLGDILATSSTRTACGRRWCVPVLKVETKVLIDLPIGESRQTESTSSEGFPLEDVVVEGDR